MKEKLELLERENWKEEEHPMLDIRVKLQHKKWKLFKKKKSLKLLEKFQFLLKEKWMFFMMWLLIVQLKELLKERKLLKLLLKNQLKRF
jgi:hypothetical protein